MSILKKVEELTDLASKIHVYKFNLSYAYSFFAYGCMIIGAFLIAIGIALVTNLMGFAILMVALALGFAGAFCALHAVFKDILRKTKPQKYEGIFWPTAFATPFALFYILGGMFQLPFVDILWYPALGTALLLVGLLIERGYVSQKILLARPFLVCGILIIITSIIVLVVHTIATARAIEGAGHMLAMGFILIIYFSAATYTMIRANKIFESL